MTAWERPPSKALCAGECGARCCKAPGHLRLSAKEAARLAFYNPQVKFLRDPDDTRFIAPLVLDFADNGGQCPMLAADNTCTIYAQRPVACIRFPQRPTPDCLVWPHARSDQE